MSCKQVEDHFNELTYISDDEIDVPEKFDFKCGFCRPRPSEEEMERLYELVRAEMRARGILGEPNDGTRN